MAWRCQQCGHENEDSAATCQGCGGVRPARLALSSEATGKRLVMRISTDVGKHLLRGVVADDAKYGSDPQFRVTCDRANGVWMIQHHAEAKNPTFLDGAPLSAEPAALKEGAVVSIGADKAKLTVKMEYES